MWGPWPAGQDPTVVGNRLVQNLVDRPKLDVSKGISYLETCSGYGAVRVAYATENVDLLGKVAARYQGIIEEDGTGLLPKPNHVDRSMFGILPLELFQESKNPKYLALGLRYADAQFATTNPEGLSAETRYYIDDAYKISVMQIQAFRVLKETEGPEFGFPSDDPKVKQFHAAGATPKAVYAAHAVKEMTAFIDKFQQPTGLFFHGPDAHIYWGRGNGWIAAGLAEVLTFLPADDPGRPKIMASYKAMMAGLLKVQAPDGRWRQVLDDDKAWEENSCTGYFIFALGEGVNQGWLDAGTYKPAVKKAWEALCGQLDAQGNVADVGVLTEHSNDEAYYLARPRQNGNLHGQFAMMWAAAALLGQ